MLISESQYTLSNLVPASSIKNDAKKKNWLTFSSLNHFPWQSCFQPVAINLSSLSRRSQKSKCGCTTTLSIAWIAGQELLWLRLEFPSVRWSRINCKSQFALLDFCKGWKFGIFFGYKIIYFCKLCGASGSNWSTI